VVGRESGAVRLSVEEHSDGATLNRVVREAKAPPAVVNTDDWRGYYPGMKDTQGGKKRTG
jgi:hypothetical protein